MSNNPATPLDDFFMVQLQAQGTDLPQRPIIDFDDTFTVSDDAPNNRIVVSAVQAGTGATAHLVIGGETYTLAESDTVVFFDTSNGETAIAQMIAPSYPGQRWTFYWWNWDQTDPVAPTILTPAGTLAVPASGPTATPGNAGLVASTTMPTPGGSYSLVWDGTHLAQTGPEGGALIPGASRISVSGPSCSALGVGSVLLTGSTLTDMSGGQPGQIVVITIKYAGSAVTRAGASGNKFLLSGSQNCTAATGFATLTVVYEPGAGGWVEITRSTSNG